MKPAVLFDLGNTLAAYYRSDEFAPILEEAVDGMLAELKAHDLAPESPNVVMERAIAENRESADCRVTPLAGRLERIFGLSFAGHAGLESLLCERFLAPICRRGRLYDDTLALLDTLRRDGFPVGVVSNTPWGSPSALWRRELSRLGLEGSLDAVVFCGDVGWRKPAPQIFEHAAPAVGREPRLCLFVGDDPEWDMAGSEAAGMRAVLIDRDGRFPDYGGDRIESLSGILGLLQPDSPRTRQNRLVIRRAALADVERLAGIYNEAIETSTATFDIRPKSLDERTRWLRAHGDRFPVLAGEQGGTVVGFASLTPWSEREAYDGTAETGLYVHSAWQGRGIGRQLYAAIIEEARRLGFHTLIARVTAESSASIHLHEDAGFRVVGTMSEVGRKFGRWLDVLIMQKMLD